MPGNRGMRKQSIDFLTRLFGRIALPYSCDVFGLVNASLRPRAAVPGSKRTPGSPRLRWCRSYLHLRSQPLLARPCLEAVNPLRSRHLANGQYGFRSKFPVVGDPLRSLMARAQTDGRKSGDYDIRVLHDEGKGGPMTTVIERAIRNFVRYTNDETNPILMSLRGLVAEAPKLVPRELRKTITDHRCDLKDRQGPFSHGALESTFQSERDRSRRVQLP